MIPRGQRWSVDVQQGADNDLLSPGVCEGQQHLYYGFNIKTQPVSMGTTVGFLNCLDPRLFEITNIRREGA